MKISKIRALEEVTSMEDGKKKYDINKNNLVVHVGVNQLFYSDNVHLNETEYNKLYSYLFDSIHNRILFAEFQSQNPKCIFCIVTFASKKTKGKSQK